MNSDFKVNHLSIPTPEISRNGKTSPEIILEKSEEDGFDIKEILAILKRRSSILVPVFTAVTTLGVLAAVFRPPSYLGNFSLLIEPVTRGQRLTNTLTASQEAQRTDEAMLMGALPYDPEYVSQIAVLKSQNLLEPIAERIQGRYPDITPEILSARLTIKNPKDTKILEITYRDNDPDRVRYILESVSQGFLRYSIEDRQINLRKGLEYVDDQVNRQEGNVQKLEARLEAFRRANSLTDPTEGSRALTTQLSALLSAQRDNQVKYATARTQYVNLAQQLRLDPAEGVVVANLSESPGYNDLLGKLREVEAKLAKESARLSANTPVVQALQDERDQLLPLLQAEAQRVLGKSRAPEQADLQKLGFQGSIGRGLIKDLVETANEVRVLQVQQMATTNAIKALNDEIRGMATVSRNYEEIARNLAISTDSLSRLQAARENLQLEYTRQSNPWQMLSKIDENSIRDVSGTNRSMLLATFAGLILGVFAAFLAEKFDRNIHSPEDLKSTRLPVLGLIPYQEQLKEIPVISSRFNLAAEAIPAGSEQTSRPARGYGYNRGYGYDTVAFLEAFYSLDANLRLLNSDSPIRSIVMTSATPGEGKSTSSIHLAIAAATMGRRVLLVDADLRLPQFHQRLDLPNFHGLSNLLTSDLDPMEVIQHYSYGPTEFSVLTAGQLPPSPGRLFSSKKMAKIAEYFTAQFDLVIFDCPPTLGFADAKLLATYTDGILFVVGLGQAKREDVKQAIEELNTTSQSPVLGLLVNTSKRSSGGQASYYRYQKYYQKYHNSTIELELTGELKTKE